METFSILGYLHDREEFAALSFLSLEFLWDLVALKANHHEISSCAPIIKKKGKKHPQQQQKEK